MVKVSETDEKKLTYLNTYTMITVILYKLSMASKFEPLSNTCKTISGSYMACDKGGASVILKYSAKRFLT
jgi:hypothetical protein